MAELGRSTDESSLTRGPARGVAVVTNLAHRRDIRGVPQGCYQALRCHRRPCGRATVPLSGRHRFAGCRFLAGMPASSAPIGKAATPRDAAEPFGPTNGGFPAASRTDPPSRRRRPRRSTDESPLTRASSKAAPIASSVRPMSRELRWVPAERLAGLSLRRLPRRPSHRFHMSPAPFCELSLPWRYAHQLLSHRRACDATSRRRTIRSYERRFDRGFQD